MTVTTADITAPDISCDHCRRTIEEGLARTPGVRSVSVDVAARRVHVEYEPDRVDRVAIEAELDELGYPAA